jgi:glycine betaine/proline transport system permease protein
MSQGTDDPLIPKIPVGDWFETGFDWVKDTFDAVFDGLATGLRFLTDGLTDLLLLPPPIVAVLVFALIGFVIRSWRFALLTVVGMGLVVGMEMWEHAMLTLSMALVATVIAVVIAIPVGILAARSDAVSAVVRPVLDFMQTMPAFVYLVPAVTLFSIGVVPGVVSTIIFALPPGVRLTELGIRQVDKETVEAGQAFGSSPGQILRGIQLPLAMPTIMAGVNQVIMLSLSMAVIAGLVGAGGLGGQVVTSISRLNLGLGFEAGLAVVVLAIYLDRLTAAIGHPGASKGSLRDLLGSRRARARSEAVEAAATSSGDEVAAGRKGAMGQAV